MCKVKSCQATRTGCIYGHTGASEIKGPADAVRKERGSNTGAHVFGRPFSIAKEHGLIIAVGCSNKNAGIGAGDSL